MNSDTPDTPDAPLHDDALDTAAGGGIIDWVKGLFSNDDDDDGFEGGFGGGSFGGGGAGGTW